jgi:hypothetical protein
MGSGTICHRGRAVYAMIRIDPAGFRVYRPLYAVDLASFRTYPSDPAWGCINAVWFRRKNKVLAACMGTVRSLQSCNPPRDAAQFLAQHLDNRYGGDCQGRYDNRGYWGPDGSINTIVRQQRFLEAMLAAYPAIPEGYDGWWGFPGAWPRAGVLPGVERSLVLRVTPDAEGNQDRLGGRLQNHRIAGALPAESCTQHAPDEFRTALLREPAGDLHESGNLAVVTRRNAGDRAERRVERGFVPLRHFLTPLW